MGLVEFKQDAIEIDGDLVAEGLGIDRSTFQERMRQRQITSRLEQGIGEDEGLYRLTFFSEHRRLRFIVDAAGNVIQRSMIDFGDHPLPPATRKLG